MKLHDLGPAVPLLIALVFQGWVTYRVWRSRAFERAQKLNQSKLIWLLPVLGAVMVFSARSSDSELPRIQWAGFLSQRGWKCWKTVRFLDCLSTTRPSC